MRNLLTNIALLIIIGFLGISTCNANEDVAVCTKKDAREAEEGIDKLTDWDTAYKWYKRFAHCDDASISEGYSDVAGRLLAYRWEDFDEFLKLADADSKFEQFVLLHLNMTIPMKYYQKIIENCSNQCPQDGKRLCELIKAKAVE